MDKTSHLHITLFMLLMINNYIKPSEYSEKIKQLKINETAASIIQPNNKLKIISRPLTKLESSYIYRILSYVATIHHQIILCDEDNEDIAYISYTTSKSEYNPLDLTKTAYSENKPNDKIFFIARLHVISKYQGKGIGTKLMNTVIDHAKEENFKSILLESTYSAESFYNKLGFYSINNSPEMPILQKYL